MVFDSNNNPTSLVTYRCNLFKNLNYGYGDNKYSKSEKQSLKNADNIVVDQEWKNYCVIDDCSKFAAAVYYHYINKEILENNYMADKTAYDIDLWGTNSSMFSNINHFTNKLMSTNKFSVIKWSYLNKQIHDEILNVYYDGRPFNLQVGDLIYREGHVEFYIGNNRVVGWGRIHNTYFLKKSFNPKLDGYHSDDVLDDDKPYITIIRFTRSYNENKQ